jgi:hypothetical protein
VEWVGEDGVMEVMECEEDESAIACVMSSLRWACKRGHFAQD